MSTAVATLDDMEPAQAPGPVVRRELDPESQVWLEELGGTGTVHDAAVERLYELLLRAARFEASRRKVALTGVSAGELDQIVQDTASDALVAVLARLHEFRGLSKFTTWAYKFAILETAVKLRRRAWRDREIPQAPELWERVPETGHSPDEEVQQAELLGAIGEAIATALTPRQREVLVAVAVNCVPIDVLAERLGSTRGALYKTLHDARQKLRMTLAHAGFDIAGESGGER